MYSMCPDEYYFRVVNVRYVFERIVLDSSVYDSLWKALLQSGGSLSYRGIFIHQPRSNGLLTNIYSAC